MNYEIVELDSYSGEMAKVYSIIPDGKKESLFDEFVSDHISQFKIEIIDLNNRLFQIGHTSGARENFFKHEGDRKFRSKYGNYIYALFDEDDKKLRLYCIRFSNVAIILGGGGYKDKSIVKWQDSENLSNKVNIIMSYAERILKQIDDGDLYWSKDGNELLGNFKYSDDE